MIKWNGTLTKKFFYIILLLAGCKEAYNPPVETSNPNYLVVEGNIVVGDSTFIHLSRTIGINDTSIIQPERNAIVSVESEDGESYGLQNMFNGNYFSPLLPISSTRNYRLHIFTADQKEYVSEYVPVKITPPIDSVSWKFDSTHGVNIYVTTHDATNSTQYYRWKTVSCWEHRASDSSELIYENGALRFRTPQEEIYRCWNIDTTGDIFLASTAALSSDIVFEKKLAYIPYRSTQIRWVYSILVTQYALTKDAFEYWQNLKKNTEEIGSIFDPQPFAEFGNIHCVTNPAEPVLGFISCCSTSKQRIYIFWSQVHFPYDLPDCKKIVVSPSDIDEVFSGYRYLPLRYGDFGSVFADYVDCLDCRLQGGTNVKPPYMPR